MKRDVSDNNIFLPGTLWQRVVATNARALEQGALQPIHTVSRYIQDQGIEFLVRAVDRLADKEETKRADATTTGTSTAKPSNPFLPPYQVDLYVADASPSHACLLNKFQVIKHHLLIVTRAFEPQESPLSLADFEALGRCMAEYDSLAFYNGGTVAGASQPHKHLQVVPLPLSSRGPAVPVESVLGSFTGGVERCGTSELPFRHVVARLDQRIWEQPQRAATTMLRIYRESLALVGLDPDAADPGPYNLLVTRRWMLLVPRACESFESISLNSLAFAGSIFVRDEAQLARIESRGPMAALLATGFPLRR